MHPIPVYLLAGGQSSRFGSDKARAEVGGAALLVRLARSLQPLAASVTVVADRAGKYQDLGLVTIADAVPGLGPLGGLQTALAHAGGPGWTLVASCDLLELRAEWIERLWEHTTDGTRAVAYRDRFWQAFPGLYHTSLLPQIEHRLRSGDGAVWRLLQEAPAVGLPLPADWPVVAQMNTPEDLAAYLAQAQKQ